MAKKINSDLIQPDKTICYICNKPIFGNADPHHIFGGTANREKSDVDDFVVMVHRTCHRWIHDHPFILPKDEIRDSYLQQKARCQKIWEKHCGTREEFIERYGRSFIDELEWRKHGKKNTNQ